MKRSKTIIAAQLVFCLGSVLYLYTPWHVPNKQCSGFIKDSFGYNMTQEKLPVDIIINQDLIEEEETAIRSAIDTWNRSTGIDLFVLRVAKDSSDPGSIRYLKKWEYEKTHTAQTNIIPRGHFIKEFSILLNTDLYQFSTNYSPTAVDLQSVILHELGHVLGLDHETNDLQSVMNPNMNPGEYKRDISFSDISRVKDQYEKFRPKKLSYNN